MKREFGEILRQYRLELKLTLDSLATLTGLTKQYINALEKKRQNVPSLKKLRSLLLILSQDTASTEFLHNKVKVFQQSDLKKKDKEKQILNSENSIEHSPKESFEDADFINILEQKARPERFFSLLLSALDLPSFENKIVYIDNVTSKFEVDNFIEFNALKSTLFSNINHQYQIWTLTDIMGEKISEKAARQTAEYIVKYKITYYFFVPLNDNTHWKEALTKLKFHVEEIFDKMPKYKDFWNAKNPLDEHLKIFGIGEGGHLIRLRIYNPHSEKARGNFNIGGLNLNEVRFADMHPEYLRKIEKILEVIISNDAIGNFDDNSVFLIEELGVKASRKFPITKQLFTTKHK